MSNKYEIGYIANNEQEFKRKIRDLNLVKIIDELEHTPSLNKLSRINKEGLIDEVVLLLIQTDKFFNVKNGLTEDVLYDIADLILSEYKHLTMYDLGLCFKMAKIGRFGKVYERLDGGVVMDWICQYENLRDKAIIRNAQDAHSRTKADSYREKTNWINFNQI